MEALQTTPHGIRCRGGASPAAGGRIWECWILASWADDLAGVSQSGAPARFGGGRPFALVGRFASSRWVASHPPQTQYQTQYIYLEVEYIYISKRNIYLEVNTTSNMVHQLTDIYIPHTHADSPPNHRGWGAP